MTVTLPGLFIFHAGICCGMTEKALCKRQFDEEMIARRIDLDEDRKNARQIVIKSLNESWWSLVTDGFTFLFFGGLCTSIIVDVFGFHYDSNFYYQFLGPILVMPVKVSLTLDNGLSNFARFRQLPFPLWMGKVSMCVYLVQECIIQYLTAIVNVFAPSQFFSILLEMSTPHGG